MRNYYLDFEQPLKEIDQKIIELEGNSNAHPKELALLISEREECIKSIFSTLTAASVIILRVKEPNVVRPWKVPLYPIIPLLYCFFNFWVIYYIIINRPISALTGFVFLFCGFITYYFLNKS